MVRNRYIILLMFQLVAITKVAAQAVNTDTPVIEVLIRDHKRQRTLLLVRAVVEETNKSLHNITKERTNDYHDMTVELDRYTRAFDILDIVLASASSAFQTVKTINVIKEDIGKYQSLLERYKEKCLDTGNVLPEDLMIVDITADALAEILTEVNNIYLVLADISAYVAVPQRTCTSEQMIMLISSFEASLKSIQKILNSSYFETYKYIMARTGFWKKALVKAQFKSEVIDDAFGRWLNAALQQQVP